MLYKCNLRIFLYGCNKVSNLNTKLCNQDLKLSSENLYRSKFQSSFHFQTIEQKANIKLKFQEEVMYHGRRIQNKSRIKWFNGCFYQWVVHEIKFPYFLHTSYGQHFLCFFFIVFFFLFHGTVCCTKFTFLSYLVCSISFFFVLFNVKCKM